MKLESRKLFDYYLCVRKENWTDIQTIESATDPEHIYNFFWGLSCFLMPVIYVHLVYPFSIVTMNDF